jgi:hypothetical protein
VERSPSKIGVDHHSGRIDHSTESWSDLKVNLLPKEGIKPLEREKGISQLGKLLLMEDFFSQSAQSFPDGFHHDIAGVDLQEVDDLRS